MLTAPPGPFGNVIQVAWVVEDIEIAMARWTAQLGVGPFFHFPHFPLMDVRYRGSPSTIDVDIALAFSGSLCFEFLQQNDRSPSILREHVESRGYGFHHWGVATPDFDAALARASAAGTPAISTFTVAAGGRAAYLDTTASLGAIVELIDVTPEMKAFFGMVQAASIDWDGKDPVRRTPG